MKNLHDYYLRADTFAEMAAASPEYGRLLTAQRERATVPADLLARVEAMGGQWHLLVISEDWCIDSQSLLPVVSALADSAKNLDLRQVRREAEPELMDTHRSNGTARAIPVVILLDADFQERAWWGSRPQPLKERVAADWKDLEKADRNKEVRRWYAMDKGRTTLEEIASLLEQVAAIQPMSAIAGV